MKLLKTVGQVGACIRSGSKYLDHLARGRKRASDLDERAQVKRLERLGG